MAAVKFLVTMNINERPFVICFNESTSPLETKDPVILYSCHLIFNLPRG